MTESDIAKEGGAVCEMCKRRMLIAKGCIAVKVPIYGGPALRGKQRKPIKQLLPIKFGSETRFAGSATTTKRCHDCGALPGNFHHPGCDWEECPGCHQQMLMCGGECGTVKKHPLKEAHSK